MFIQDIYLLPSQFQDLDPHCSCQNTSSNPAVDTRHTLALKSTHRTYRRLGMTISPGHNIQKPRLTSCHCAKRHVVWRRQNSFKLMLVDIRFK